MSTYSDYYLRDNPFPVAPILDPYSEKAQLNGTIYNPDIMAGEIESFRSKIARRPPLIYIENKVFERGVGKSALLVQQWRQLQKRNDITSVYVRSGQKLMPTDFAAHLVNRWHHDQYLWSVVLRVLTTYVEQTPHGEITLAGAKRFCETFPRLPLRGLSLPNFNVFNPDRLINDLAAWAYRQVGDTLHYDLALVFFQSYLSDPRTFPDAYPAVLRKHKWDNIAMLAAVYRLLRLAGYDYNYLFFDQFEDVVHGLSGKSLLTFSAEMRRFIEASIGQATVVVTLHPGAALALDSPDAVAITSIAPRDERHVVEVRPLAREGANLLCHTYLDYFRLPDLPPPNPLYPFTNEAIELIYEAAKGNVRGCLQAFNYAIEKGIETGTPLADKEFVIKYHSDISGRVHRDAVSLSR